MPIQSTYRTPQFSPSLTFSPFAAGLLAACLTTGLAAANLNAQGHAASKGHPLASCDIGQRSPDAPKELDQYAFLIGNFDIKDIRRNRDGSWKESPSASYWEGRWILQGHAVADYWYDTPPVAGTVPGRGVNVRMYRPESKLWTNMWQHSRLAEVRTLISEVRDDGLMHMWASHPDTSDRRRMRFEIKSPDEWVRIEEQSRDEGKTWFEVDKLQATRAPCPWLPPASRTTG